MSTMVLGGIYMSEFNASKDMKNKITMIKIEF